jgi:recombination protein RecA
MSKALRKMTALSARSQTSIMFINQIRMKIGVMFGSPETTTGGNALKFYASVRLDVRRIGSIKDQESEDGDIKGNRVRVKVVKNKVAPPFREAEFDVIFNEGISQVGEIVDLGVEKGIIDKTGAWYSFRGERIGQGRESAKTFLREHPELTTEIRGLVLSTMGIETNPAQPLAAAKQRNGLDNSKQPEAVTVDKAGSDKGAKAMKRRPEGTVANA